MQIILQTPINSLGYGVFGLGYFNILQKLHNDKVYLLPLGNPNFDAVKDLLTVLNLDLSQSNIISDISQVSGDALTLCIWHYHEAFKVVGSRKIIHSTFETDVISTPDVIKNSVNKILTASSWGENVLNKYSLNCGKTVGPASLLGYDNSKNTKFDFLKDELIPNAPTYLSCGKWEKRKNQMLLLDIVSEYNLPLTLIGLWSNIFTDGVVEPVKYLNNKQWQLSAVKSKDGYLAYIYTKNNKKVILLSYIHSYTDMLSVYNLADVYITLASGEGWDLPLVEAMSLGIPAICTDNTAHIEYANSSNSFLIPCTIKLANDGIFFNGQQGNWYPVYDKKDVIAYLLKINSEFTYYRDSLKGLGEAGKNSIYSICYPERIYSELQKHCEF